MKLLEIALFLFNILEFAISTDKLIPNNVEIVLKPYVDPLTRERQDGLYERERQDGVFEKRSNYLEAGEKYPSTSADLSDEASLQGIADQLKEAADGIVDRYNAENEDKLNADDEAKFSVTFIGLDVQAVSNLLAKQPNPRRVSGEVKIGNNWRDLLKNLDAQLAALHGTGAAAAGAAEQPPTDAANSISTKKDQKERRQKRRELAIDSFKARKNEEHKRERVRKKKEGTWEPETREEKMARGKRWNDEFEELWKEMGRDEP